MGFETRGKARYFYRKTKVDGRVRSVYCGREDSGSAALAMDQMRATAESRRKSNAALRAAKQAIDAAEAAETAEVVAYGRRVEERFHEAMRDAGFHFRERVWSRPMKGKTELDEALEQERARRYFGDSPSDSMIEEAGGDLAQRVAEGLLTKYVAAHRQRQAIRKKMERLRTDLLAVGSSAIEVLLVSRVVLNWLDVHISDIQALRHFDEDGGGIMRADHLDRRRTQAQRRYTQAIRALSTVRKLAIPAVHVVHVSKEQSKARSEQPKRERAGGRNRISRHLEPAEN